MAITQDILTVYAALAEHIYRRDSQNDQALNLSDIAKVLGLNDLPAIDASNPDNAVPVTGQDGNPLVSWTDSGGIAQTNLAADDIYYYSDRGFVGMIVQVGGKHVVVFRGTDTALSGWGSVRASAFGSGTTFDGHRSSSSRAEGVAIQVSVHSFGGLDCHGAARLAMTGCRGAAGEGPAHA